MRVAYLHGTKLVGNRRKLRCETVVSDCSMLMTWSLWLTSGMT